MDESLGMGPPVGGGRFSNALCPEAKQTVCPENPLDLPRSPGKSAASTVKRGMAGDSLLENFIALRMNGRAHPVLNVNC